MDKRQYEDLPPVAKTLLIPLGCRAAEAERQDGILNDLLAAEVFKRIGGSAAALKGLEPFDQVALVMRARQFDRFANYFLNLHPDGLVVDIGCGLDTRFSRIDNGRMRWLGLDLPEVIRLRRELIPDGTRSRTISGSVFDLGWIKDVRRYHKAVIFLVEAVFMYFPQVEVESVLCAIAKEFKNAEVVFDISSSHALRMHNRNSGILKRTKARLQWAVDDPRSLEKLGLKLVDVWGYFDEREPRLGIWNLMRFVPAWRDAGRVVLYKTPTG